MNHSLTCFMSLDDFVDLKCKYKLHTLCSSLKRSVKPGHEECLAIYATFYFAVFSCFSFLADGFGRNLSQT